MFDELQKILFTRLELQIKLVSEGLRNVASEYVILPSDDYITDEIEPLLKKYSNLEYLTEKIQIPMSKEFMSDFVENTFGNICYQYSIVIFSNMDVLNKWKDAIKEHRTLFNKHTEIGEMYEYPYPFNIYKYSPIFFSLNIYIDDDEFDVLAFKLPTNFSMVTLKKYYLPFVEYYRSQKIPVTVVIRNDDKKYSIKKRFDI